MTQHSNKLAMNRRAMLTGLGLGVGAGMAGAVPALAANGGSTKPDSSNDAIEIVDNSALVVKRMRNSEVATQANYLLQRCKGVMVFPELVKAGFGFGGEGGTGVLSGKDDAASWSDPAFYSQASVNFGLQIGAQITEVVLILMTDAALMSALNNNLEVGGDASATAGPIGMDFEVSTTTALKDIYYYAKPKGGIYAGASVELSGFAIRKDLNHAYYGSQEANPKSIVLDRKFRSRHSQMLISMLQN